MMHSFFFNLRQFFIHALLCIPAVAVAQEWKTAYSLARENWGNSWNLTVDYLTDAESVARHDLGIFDPDYLVILNDLGLALYESGKVVEAVEVLERSLQYRREILQKDDKELLIAAINLARVSTAVQPEKARGYFLDLLKVEETEIRLKATKSLYDLYVEEGDIRSASELVKNINIEEREGRYLRNLLMADIFRRQGLYKESADELSKLEEDLRQEDAHDLLVKSVQALYFDQKGMLSLEKHAFASAEESLSKALEIKNHLGLPEEEFIVTYNSLARLYQEFGLYNKALESIDQALQHCAHHCEILLQNKASIYLITGDLLEAELIYTDIYDNYSFKKPADELEFLLNYSNTFQKGSLSRMNPALEKAILLVDEYRDELPQKDLGHYYAALGSWQVRNGAIHDAIQALEKSRTYYMDVYGEDSFMLRKSEMYLGLCYVMNQDIDQGLAMLRKANDRERDLIRYVYPVMSRSEQMVFMSELRDDLNLFYSAVIPQAKVTPSLRNLLFEKQLIYKGLTLQAIRASSANADIRIPVNIKEEYTALRERLTKIYTEGIAAEQGFNKNDIERLRELDVRIARETGSRLSGLPDLDSIRSSLATDELLVEIIRYMGQSSTNQQVNYAALVIDPAKEYLELASFTSGDELENRQLKYYLNTINFEYRDTLSYEKFWGPIEPFTDGKENCYLVSDGLFYKVNPAVLWMKEKRRFLGEDLSIRQLNNAAEVLVVKSTNSALSGEHRVLLVGDPDLSEISNSRFRDLPGTREEIHALEERFRQKNWEVNTLASEEATKAALDSANYGTIMHFATHGFFSRKDVAANSDLPDLDLFRSGLVLSSPDNGKGDLLTAFEVTDLELSSVNLAVLSACETGLGDLKNGDGVYGLQYAFFSAGVQSVLLSLWQVNDEVTKEYMVSFYEKLLETGNKREAYESVEARMREKYKEPKYWGAFIYLGD